MGSPVSWGPFRCGIWEHETGFPEFANISTERFLSCSRQPSFLVYVVFLPHHGCSQPLFRWGFCPQSPWFVTEWGAHSGEERRRLCAAAAAQVPSQRLQQGKAHCWSWSHHRGLWPGAISCGKLRTLQDGYLEDILRAENPESHLERHISFSVHHLKAKGPFFPPFLYNPLFQLKLSGTHL